MKTKRVIIVDDEPAARNNLKEVIAEFEFLTLVAEIGDGASAIEQIQVLQPDIVFLDIKMPELNGFEVACATEHIPYQLIFSTAYGHYALEAFNTRAIDYLVKPVRPSLVAKCIDKLMRHEKIVLQSLQSDISYNSVALSDLSSSKTRADLDGVSVAKAKEDNAIETDKYGKSKLDPSLREAIVRRFMDCMAQEKLFLDDELSFRDVAEKLECTTHHLSQAINCELGKNFNDLIAELRVNEAKKLLLESSDRSILDICLSAGFKSKSGFYKAFKRYTQLTPSEFREKIEGGFLAIHS